MSIDIIHLISTVVIGVSIIMGKVANKHLISCLELIRYRKIQLFLGVGNVRKAKGLVIDNFALDVLISTSTKSSLSCETLLNCRNKL